MPDKYQNKYRTDSQRLQNWDYSWAGAYFITICTHDRKHFFGEIEDGKMHLSHCGIVADIFWHEIKSHTQNIDLGAFVVMPNHIHGVLIIHENDGMNGGNVENVVNGANGANGTNVETRHALSLPPPQQQQQQQQPQTPPQTIGQQRFQNQGKRTVSSIIGGYKSAVTKHLHRLNYEFAWQSRFYDNIIRDEKAYQQISDYIINNPARWNKDKFKI